MNITTENLVAEIRHFEQQAAAYESMLRGEPEGTDYARRLEASRSFAQQRVRRLRRKAEVTL